MISPHNDVFRKIYTYNYPLPQTIKDQLDTLVTGPAAFNVALLAIFALGFLQASFAVFLTAVRFLDY